MNLFPKEVCLNGTTICNKLVHPVQVRRDQYDLPPSRVYEPIDQLVFKYNTPLFGDDKEYLNQFDSSRVFRKLPNIGGATLSDSSGTNH